MKHFNRKIKIAIAGLMICLVAFIGFSKAGILFSEDDSSIVTVSASKKTFDPNNYVASVETLNEKIKETTTQIQTTENKVETTTKKEIATTTTAVLVSTWSGSVLTKSKGVVNGPSGKETYYNLNMNSVINGMRQAGYSEEEYPYWVREDGVKMLGKYIMVAANYEIRPKGTILESSLGYAIVCDTGSFVKTNPTQIDIAVTWR